MQRRIEPMDEPAESTDNRRGGENRYADREIGNGTVEIFDTENEDAWIQSDVAIELS